VSEYSRLEIANQRIDHFSKKLPGLIDKVNKLIHNFNKCLESPKKTEEGRKGDRGSDFCTVSAELNTKITDSIHLLGSNQILKEEIEKNVLAPALVVSS